MTATSVRLNGWVAFAVAAAASAVAVITFVAVIEVPVGGENFVVAFDDIGEAAAAFIAAASCALVAKRAAGRLRRGWGLLAASAAAWGLGEVIWSAYEVGLKTEVPSPSFADLGFLAAMPLAAAGVLCFWTSPRGTAHGWRIWLDALIILVSLTFSGWALGLKEVYLAPGSSSAEQAIALAYPAGDIIIGTVLILAIRRATRIRQGPLLCVLGGLAAISISDSTFAYLSATDTSAGVATTFDTGWVVGYLLIALAALWPLGQERQAIAEDPIDLWQLSLPWIAVLIASASAVVLVLRGGLNDQFMTVLAAMLGALLMVSQILAHKDSRSMLVKSQASESRLAEVLAHAPVGIARTDTDFKVTDANPALVALFHESRDAMIGSTIAKYLQADAQHSVFEKLGSLVTGAVETVEAESPMVRADGSPVWVHWTSTAVKKATSDATDYFLTMLEDASERHEAEEAARTNLAFLEHLNAMKNEFLQSVSHEFKTALIGIEGFSELMLDAALGVEEVKAFATEIHDGATRLDVMVTEILELDRVVVDPTTLQLQAVDLNALITRVVEEIRLGIDGTLVTTQLDSSLPTVVGDPAKLSQVLKDLLRNALKYSPEGGRIVVSSQLRDGQAEVMVRDQGAGIRGDFDNFVLGHDDLYANNPIRKVIGTGLGFAMAREVVRMHGGRLWVVRLEGIGSEFHFTLPLASATRLPEVETASEGKKVA
jgi:PAS domain S-box-containing protein